MIILDTNVVSEPMRAKSNPAVQRWLDSQVAETLYLTATSLSELLVGIQILPEGNRKLGLTNSLKTLLSRLFGTRILSFDQAAAVAYAPLIGHARAIGCPISVADGQIAAIASLKGFKIATRDVAPFVALGVSVINPWEERVDD